MLALFGTAAWWAGVIPAFLAGMAFQACRRAWRDRRTATTVAKAARRAAWRAIPRAAGFLAGLGAVFILLMWAVVTRPHTATNRPVRAPSPVATPATTR